MSNYSWGISDTFIHGDPTYEWVQDNFVEGGQLSGTTGTPPRISKAKSVYETDWASLSAAADANTLYVVVPDPVP